MPDIGRQAETAYLAALRKVFAEGKSRSDRTGTGTRSLFGLHLDFGEVGLHFPLLTTKKMFWRGIVAELLWFIGGHTNVQMLNAYDVHIWDEWADEYGELGHVYGAQWRGHFDDYYHQARLPDQLADVIDGIKENPNSRRHLVSAWNPAELEDMALPPCHYAFQFYVDDGKLSLMWQQRSADMFLGLPFNIASYALLLHIVAELTRLRVGSLKCTIGDAHIYDNHVDQVELQLSRRPRVAPGLRMPDWSLDAKSIDDFGLNKADPKDFKVFGYAPHPAIKAPKAI